MNQKKTTIIVLITALVFATIVLFITLKNEQPNIKESSTAMFTSKILKIEFEYPVAMGVFTEKILPASDMDKSGPFEKWSINYNQPAINKYPSFSIRADNMITATSVHEGCGPMFKYYGQPLENICNTKEFLNINTYDTKLNTCELMKSKNDVPYVYFEAEGVSNCEYGGLDKKRSFSFVNRAIASTFPIERYAGIFFKTQSDKWPGASFILNSIEWENNAIIFPGGSKSKNGILPLQNIQIIKDVAKTLRYIK